MAKKRGRKRKAGRPKSKTRKSSKEKIPLKILEKRLKRLNNVVKTRHGDAF
jgi:hypothetical protein